MTSQPEITKIFTLKKLPFHNSDGSSDITLRYGDGFVLEYRVDRKAKVTRWNRIDTETNEVTRLTEYEFGKLVPSTTRAISKVEIVYHHRNKIKWTVDLYKGSDVITARLDSHTNGAIDDWMQEVILEEVTSDELYSDYNLALNTITLSDAESLEKGDKVIFIPEGKEYDFGYIGGTEKIIIYKVGERSMQDSSAVDTFNISILKEEKEDGGI